MTGYWLYGLAAAGPDPEWGAAGIGVGPLFGVEVDPAFAILQAVHLEDWTGPEAEARLAAIETLAPLVQRHAGIQGRLHAKGPFVPARFGTLFSSLAAVSDAVRAAGLDADLRRLGDAQEWSLQAWMRPNDRAPDGVAESGAAWMRQRRAWAEASRRRALERHELLDALATELEGIAVATHALDLPRAVPEGLEGETPLAHWALLLPRGAGPDLLERIADAQARADALGLRLRALGPWPPASFCQGAAADV